MLFSKTDSLLIFQPPILELTQQKDIYQIAKSFYDFFSFSDSALVFLRQYLTENFEFLKYFDKNRMLMNQGCRQFSSGWTKLNQDPSPFIKALRFQVDNITALTSSVTVIEFKEEEETREDFAKKLSNLKAIQQSIDKKFQAAWKKCHSDTSNYYQKLEEYKEEMAEVRAKYEKYEKKTRDLEGYNLTLQKQWETRLNDQIAGLKKKKEAFDKVSVEVQETYKVILTFFETNKSLVDEFIRLLLSTLMDMTIFIVEKARDCFIFLRTATTEIVQKLAQVDLQGSWKDEDRYIKSSFSAEVPWLVYMKEISRINHQRHEFLTAFGSLSQDTMHLCQGFIERYFYFEERNTFEAFISQFDEKASSFMHPFGEFFSNLKIVFMNFFQVETMDNENLIHNLAQRHSEAYSSFLTNVTHTLNQPGESPRLGKGGIAQLIETQGLQFSKTEQELAGIVHKDMERLYSSINQEIWKKVIQVCQNSLLELKKNLEMENIQPEVLRIKQNVLGNVGHSFKDVSHGLGLVRNTSTSSRFADEQAAIAEEGRQVASSRIEKYHQRDFKFLKEVKAEVLVEFVKKQNEEKWKEIQGKPYRVKGEKEKGSSPMEDETTLGSYSCAFVDNILLQGRIYIQTTKLLFKSHFNGKTLFGSTVLSVPLHDILEVQRKKNTFGLENMLRIITKKGELEFTSFVFRDEAWRIIDQLMSIANPDYAKNPKDRRSLRSGSEDFVDYEFLEPSGNGKKGKKGQKKRTVEMEFQKRNKLVMKAMPPLEKYEEQGYLFKFEVDYNTFTHTLLSGDPLVYKGKEYTSFWNLYEMEVGSLDSKVGDWNQNLPVDVTKKKGLISFVDPMERTVQGSKSLGVALPGVPKVIRYQQKQILYFMNDNQLAMHLDVELIDKPPFADTFKPWSCFIFKDLSKEEGKGMVSVEFKFYIEWLQSTMFKSVLRKGTTSEILSAKPVFERLVKELSEMGIFEKKRAELSQREQPIDSEEDDVVEEEEETVAEPEERAMLQPMREGNEKKGHSHHGNKERSEIRVSKNVVIVYFSVMLFLIGLLLAKFVYNGKHK